MFFPLIMKSLSSPTSALRYFSPHSFRSIILISMSSLTFQTSYSASQPASQPDHTIILVFPGYWEIQITWLSSYLLIFLPFRESCCMNQIFSTDSGQAVLLKHLSVLWLLKTTDLFIFHTVSVLILSTFNKHLTFNDRLTLIQYVHDLSFFFKYIFCTRLALHPTSQHLYKWELSCLFCNKLP